MIEQTVVTWIEAITANRIWDEMRDTPRLRRSFTTLTTTCDQWPAPKHLLENLPQVQELPALPAKVVSDEVAQQNIAKIRAMLDGTTWPVYSGADVEDEDNQGN